MPGINHTWSWCLIHNLDAAESGLLVFHWGLLHQCSQGILVCTFLFLVTSGFGTTGTLTSQNTIGRVLSSSVFWRSLKSPDCSFFKCLLEFASEDFRSRAFCVGSFFFFKYCLNLLRSYRSVQILYLWFRLRRCCVSRNVSIPSKSPNLLLYHCSWYSLTIPFNSVESVEKPPLSFLILPLCLLFLSPSD